jgi:hypothetical protein
VVYSKEHFAKNSRKMNSHFHTASNTKEIKISKKLELFNDVVSQVIELDASGTTNSATEVLNIQV